MSFQRSLQGDDFKPEGLRAHYVKSTESTVVKLLKDGNAKTVLYALKDYDKNFSEGDFQERNPMKNFETPKDHGGSEYEENESFDSYYFRNICKCIRTFSLANFSV